MTSSRPALGRGLSALIPSGPVQNAVETVDIDLISPNPEQPRLHFEPVALAELAQSIREHGVLQPILVTRVSNEFGPATYQLIAGERRLQAARMANVTQMPVVIREAAGTELLELALVENVQREDLNPVEEALAFKRLSEEFGLTQDAIAARVGRSRVAVANTMRLLTLEDEIRTSLATGQITEGHARALVGIEDRGVRMDAWRRIVGDALTVRQAEEIARALKATAGARPARRTNDEIDPHVRDLEDTLRHALGAKVGITKSRTGGRIVISFHSDDELEGILAKLMR